MVWKQGRCRMQSGQLLFSFPPATPHHYDLYIRLTRRARVLHPHHFSSSLLLFCSAGAKPCQASWCPSKPLHHACQTPSLHWNGTNAGRDVIHPQNGTTRNTKIHQKQQSKGTFLHSFPQSCTDWRPVSSFWLAVFIFQCCPFAIGTSLGSFWRLTGITLRI